MSHIYRTEGSDRKHGALKMIGLCSCGWSGKVVNGQGNASRADCKAQWDEHMVMVEIAEEAREYEIAARAAHHSDMRDL